MKIFFFLIFIVIITGTIGISTVFSAEDNQICIDKVWMEKANGKIACVTPSTAEKLVERGWGTLLDIDEDISDEKLFRISFL